MDENNVYNRKPLGERNGIPYFSETDFYTENYEKISGDHMATFEKKGTNPNIEEGLWVEMEESTAALVRKYSKPGDKILDVGVGLGRLLSRFEDYERYGIDISWSYLDHTKNKGINVCFSRIEDMPYRKDFFDVITCTDVLEHVFDLNLALTKILEVLKPGGTLIIRVPYRENLALYLEPDYPYQYVHLRSFDENELTLLFTKIFNCKFLECGTTGYEEGGRTMRYITNHRKLTIATVVLSRILKILPRFLYRPIRNLLFFPIDINAALQKSDR